MAGNTFLSDINIRGIIDDWAKYTITLWQKELKRKKIGVTDELYKSFTHQLDGDGQALTGVLLKFKYYGRFTDMGVGKGLKAYERKNNAANAATARRYGANVDSVGRKPAKWINKIKAAQGHRLREILAEKASTAISSHTARNLSDNINIRFNG